MSSHHTYVLDTCTEADIPQLFDVWIAAFANKRLHVLSFPSSQVDPEHLRKWYYTRLQKSLKRPELRTFKITDTRTNRIVASARWGFPHQKKKAEEDDDDVAVDESHKRSEGEKEGESNSLPGMNSNLFDAVGDTLARWRIQHVKWEDTYIAYLLATHPDHQRQGLATRLLRVALDRADAEGRDAYLEASPAGYPVYFKAGFREVDRVSFGLQMYGGEKGEEEVSVCMVKKPVRGEECGDVEM